MSALKNERLQQARHEAKAVLRDIRGLSGAGVYLSLTADRGPMIERICEALREVLDERDRILKAIEK